jgi:uroporphyrin-III C-methyltransferase
VVRLKGGDPFLFGRGGEEVEALVAAGIAYEVVPGVTSALAVPAVADIPVTHRELASQLTIVTGHEDPDKAEPATDWAWLARSRGTVVILMGLDRLPDICRRLIEEGKGTHTPAAVISRGTLPDQRTVAAPLGQLAAVAAGSHLRSPAVIVVGEVARFPEMLAERLAAWPAAV